MNETKAQLFNPDRDMFNLSAVYDLAMDMDSTLDIMRLFELIHTNFPDIKTFREIDDIKQELAERDLEKFSRIQHPTDEEYDEHTESFWDNKNLVLIRIDKDSSLYQALELWYRNKLHSTIAGEAHEIADLEYALYLAVDKTGVDPYQTLLGGFPKRYNKQDLIDFISAQ